MSKHHHPHNRYERKLLELKHKRNRPASKDVEVQNKEADDELHGEFFETDE